ncbi:hypothetical protein FACS1894186_8690 [Alphaproteobacteria bacterium]|nr:hypothetical protein FACS1894186_8690 [Alphaproteobacteria bacterium]
MAAGLRACWNLDPGVAGIEGMTAQIRVELQIDGSVKSAAIVDEARAAANPAFRAVAESARRAVLVCDRKGEDSPFRILARLYPGDYAGWRRVILNFNPFDGGVS